MFTKIAINLNVTVNVTNRNETTRLSVYYHFVPAGGTMSHHTSCTAFKLTAAIQWTEGVVQTTDVRHLSPGNINVSLFHEKEGMSQVNLFIYFHELFSHLLIGIFNTYFEKCVTLSVYNCWQFWEMGTPSRHLEVKVRQKPSEAPDSNIWSPLPKSQEASEVELQPGFVHTHLHVFFLPHASAIRV